MEGELSGEHLLTSKVNGDHDPDVASDQNSYNASEKADSENNR